MKNIIEIPATKENKSIIMKHDIDYKWNSLSDVYEIDILQGKGNILERIDGYSFNVNNPFIAKIELFGNIFFFHHKNIYSFTVEKTIVSELEYDILKAEYIKQTEYKKRFDLLQDIPYNIRHTALKIKDNPQDSPQKTGAGRIEGCVNMGSCQCGDVNWWIDYNCETQTFTFGNSNWSNRSDLHIPYVGNALAILVNETNIIDWTYEK